MKTSVSDGTAKKFYFYFYYLQIMITMHIFINYIPIVLILNFLRKRLNAHQLLVQNSMADIEKTSYYYSILFFVWNLALTSTYYFLRRDNEYAQDRRHECTYTDTICTIRRIPYGKALYIYVCIF